MRSLSGLCLFAPTEFSESVLVGSYIWINFWQVYLLTLYNSAPWCDYCVFLTIMISVLVTFLLAGIEYSVFGEAWRLEWPVAIAVRIVRPIDYYSSQFLPEKVLFVIGDNLHRKLQLAMVYRIQDQKGLTVVSLPKARRKFWKKGWKEFKSQKW